MSQVHECGYLSSEVFFEVERVKEAAKNGDAEDAGNHLSIVEKELTLLALHCELGVTAEESVHIERMHVAVKEKKWDLVRAEALAFEKGVLMKQARNRNDGGDPLDVIPVRVWNALE